jgi:ABC-type nitrate/sulfonate/bicarbonate transport system substrate-binding protein/CheY-like chemotaxis protein
MMMPEKFEIWGVNDPNISAQLALAVRLDLFRREADLDVTCKFIESGTTMPGDILKAEKAPFAFTQTPITAILLHDEGFRTKILAPLADIAGTQQVIIHESSNISAPKDLEGKRVGMAQEAAIYMAVKKMAQDCNVDLSKVQFIDLLPRDQLTAFESGRLDAIACWEPWTAKSRTVGGKFYFSGTRSEIPGMEEDVNWLIDQSCLIVPDEHLEKAPEIVIEILNVLRKATDLINHHRKEILKELANFFGISRVELMMTMQENNYSLSIDTIFKLGVLGFRDFLYEDGRVSAKFPEDLLYDISFLQQVDRSLVLLEDAASQDITVVEKAGIYYRKDLTLVDGGVELQFLLADDSRYVRAALAQVVEIIGGKVIGEATTGSEAIDMFARLRPNFVTMDLSMPGVSGIDAIKSILQIDPNVIIIVISSADLQEVREDVFNLGVKIFIVKPFDPELVAEIIGLLLL